MTRLTSLFFALIFALSLPSAYAQTECTTDEAVSASIIYEATSAFCCAKANQRKQNKCLRKANTALKRVKGVISNGVFTSARTAINALRAASCDTAQVTPETCTDDTSTTTAEALANVEDTACDLRFQSSRVNKLKDIRRKLQKARSYLDVDYANTLRADVKDLISSRQCGQGGEQSAASCGRTVSARDGANGNVYKLSDHGALPVFVTHNGARSGTAIRTNGDTITRLNYTGLGNRDPQGLRHHYRFPISCTSLPSRFYIKLGSTCYIIDDRCGRVD